MFKILTKGTIHLMAEHRLLILKGVTIPAMIYFLLHLVRYGISRADPPISDIENLLNIPFMIADMAVIGTMLINTKRIIMLGEHPTTLSIKFSKRETKFLLYYIGFIIAWMIPAMLISVSIPLTFYSYWLVALPVTIFLGALFFTLRLSLVLVGIAVDKDISLRDSYNMTHRHQWAIYSFFFIFFCISLASYFFVTFLSGMLGSKVFYLSSYLLIHPALDILIYVTGAVALSVLYAESHNPTGDPVSAA